MPSSAISVVKVVRFANRRWICKMRVSTWRMKALSLVPPDFRGALRGCGRVDAEAALEELIDDAEGERRKPPPLEDMLDCKKDAYMCMLNAKEMGREN